ncbi:hypothetical protein V8D89_008609 [Ganoderma adspersum]
MAVIESRRERDDIVFCKDVVLEVLSIWNSWMCARKCCKTETVRVLGWRETMLKGSNRRDEVVLEYTRVLHKTPDDELHTGLLECRQVLNYSFSRRILRSYKLQLWLPILGMILSSHAEQHGVARITTTVTLFFYTTPHATAYYGEASWRIIWSNIYSSVAVGLRVSITLRFAHSTVDVLLDREQMTKTVVEAIDVNGTRSELSGGRGRFDEDSVGDVQTGCVDLLDFVVKVIVFRIEANDVVDFLETIEQLDEDGISPLSHRQMVLESILEMRATFIDTNLEFGEVTLNSAKWRSFESFKGIAALAMALSFKTVWLKNSPYWLPGVSRAEFPLHSRFNRLGLSSSNKVAATTLDLPFCARRGWLRVTGACRTHKPAIPCSQLCYREGASPFPLDGSRDNPKPLQGVYQCIGIDGPGGIGLYRSIAPVGVTSVGVQVYHVLGIEWISTDSSGRPKGRNGPDTRSLPWNDGDSQELKTTHLSDFPTVGTGVAYCTQARAMLHAQYLSCITIKICVANLLDALRCDPNNISRMNGPLDEEACRSPSASHLNGPTSTHDDGRPRTPPTQFDHSSLKRELSATRVKHACRIKPWKFSGSSLDTGFLTISPRAIPSRFHDTGMLETRRTAILVRGWAIAHQPEGRIVTTKQMCESSNTPTIGTQDSGGGGEGHSTEARQAYSTTTFEQNGGEIHAPVALTAVLVIQHGRHVIYEGSIPRLKGSRVMLNAIASSMTLRRLYIREVDRPSSTHPSISSIQITH